MTVALQLSAETILLFARADKALTESHRLADLIQGEQGRSLNKLHGMLELRRKLAHYVGRPYPSETVDG